MIYVFDSEESVKNKRYDEVGGAVSLLNSCLTREQVIRAVLIAYKTDTGYKILKDRLYGLSNTYVSNRVFKAILEDTVEGYM